jgi:hypothetical protein
VTRNDYRQLDPRVRWAPRPEGIDWIRSFNFGASFLNQWQMSSGILEDQQLQLDLLGINFESGDGLSFTASRTNEYLDQEFEISDGVPIYPGRYQYWDYRVNLRTAGQRKVGFFTNYQWGGFWDGDRKQINGRVNFRPNGLLNAGVNFERNDVSLPTGAFKANVYGLDGQVNPSPWINLTTQFQYDDVSEIVGLFARLRWIVRPGNDVYLVYTHNWINYGDGLLGDPSLTTLSRGASLKVNYTYRF